MTNPFKKYQGFGLRVNYAVNAIRAFGINPSSTSKVFHNRHFDNCFENYDGDAVVYAIMEKIIKYRDFELEKGVRLLGNTVFEEWSEHYHNAKGHQLSLF